MAYLDGVRAQSAGGGGESGEIRIIELQGTVELMPAGAQTWVFTQTNQVLHAADRLRTVSYGKEFPFDPGRDEAAFAKNRRAHFVVTAK